MNSRDHNLFSPYSNPSSDTWAQQPSALALEILHESNGVATIRFHSNPLDATPARRYLGNDPTVQSRDSGRIYLAWGAHWGDGQRLEADVNFSEVQRKIGNDGSWMGVYAGAATSWNDASLRYDSSGTVPVFFRARVRDTQGKFSTWSNIHYAAMIPTNAVTLSSKDTPASFALMQNYPNPFNPSTTIRFRLRASANIRLLIVDLTGRIVATLIDGIEMSAGEFAIDWDGTTSSGLQAPSGVYFYTMQSPSFRAVRRMLLVR